MAEGGRTLSLSAGRRRVCWGSPVTSLRKAAESWPPSHSPQRPGTFSSPPQSPKCPPLSAAQNVNLKFQTLDLTGSSLPLHSGCGRLLPEGVLLSPPRCPFFGARLILGILLSFDSEQEQVLGTLLPLVTEPRWGLTGGRWCVSPRPLLGVVAAGASQEGRWDR